MTTFGLFADGDTLRVNFGTTEIETDPAQGQTALEAQVLTALYEGLVAYDPQTLRPVPGMAESWNFSDDGLTLTFHLRAGISFEDGTTVTAGVFRASWLRILAPETRAPFAALLDPIEGAQDFREGKTTDPSQVGIETPNDSTLVLRLHEPAPHLVAVLCHYAFVPVSAQWISDPKGAPPANGPYHLTKTTPERWTLEKNPNYWDAAAVHIPRLEFDFSDDAVQVTKDYKEGKLDWVADSIDGSASIGASYVSANAVFGTSFLYIRSDKAPWTDPRVRQALILLLPLEQIRKSYLQPTSVLIPHFQGYPEVKGYEVQDKARALQLLADAGFPDGKGLPPVTMALPDNDGNIGFVKTFQDAWGAIGLDVKFTPVSGNYYDSVAKVDHTIGYFSWIGDFLDPVTFLVLWKTGSSLNAFGFSDPDFDKLLAQAAKQSADDRLKTLAKAEELLLDNGLLIPLSHTPSFHLIDRDTVGGWYPNALDIHPFKSLFWKPAKPLKNLARFDLRTKLW